MKTITVYGKYTDGGFRMDHACSENSIVSGEDNSWNTITAVLSHIGLDSRSDNEYFAYDLGMNF